MPGAEWAPRRCGWLVVQVRGGTGYLLHPRWNQAVAPCSLFLLPHTSEARFRASQICTVLLHFYQVDPERLAGLITLREQLFFETTAAKNESSARLVAPGTPLAVKFSTLDVERNGNDLPHRIQLLQLFVEFFALELKREEPNSASSADAKGRLRRFLNQTPTSELLRMSTHELVRRMGCTPRHLSRVFQDVVGMSLRDKKTELRLACARELLANNESKILDIALESGYQSMSLFNLMFKRRFGVTPGEWRKRLKANTVKSPVRRALSLSS